MSQGTWNTLLTILAIALVVVVVLMFTGCEAIRPLVVPPIAPIGS